MRIFALSDFHLSFAERPVEGKGELLKPMSVFEGRWDGCYEKIYKNCHELLRPDDYLLLAGDISWAMRLEDMENDFAFLESLPCRIVMIRGNHDYWWRSISRIRELLPSNCIALQNDSRVLDNKIVIAGTRGWPLLGSPDWKQHDDKILQREVWRLEMSLKEAEKTGLPIIAMFHYPPLLKAEPNAFTELLTAYKVRDAVYGHLHGESAANCFEGLFEGVEYHNTAADRLDFCPVPIWEE